MFVWFVITWLLRAYDQQSGVLFLVNNERLIAGLTAL